MLSIVCSDFSVLASFFRSIFRYSGRGGLGFRNTVDAANSPRFPPKLRIFSSYAKRPAKMAARGQKQTFGR